MKHCTLAIIGAGPAGLSAAMSAASEGLSTTVIEPSTVGGQSVWSNAIENVAGFPHGITGRTLANRSYRQAKRFGARFTTDRADSLCRMPTHICIQLASGRVLDTDSVIVALGVTPRTLDVPGSRAFGVYHGLNPSELHRWAHEDVAIIGCGNSAGQAAVALLSIGARVTLFCHSTLDGGMSQYLIDRIRPNATIWDDTPVTSIISVPPKVQINGHTFAAAFCFVGGHADHTLPLACDASGYIVSTHYASSMAGVYVAGDIRSNNSARRISTAHGDGAACVSAIHRYLKGQPS